MKIENYQGTLRVSDLTELDEDRVDDLVDEICAVATPDVAAVEIDLAHLRAIDSGGVGVLLAVRAALQRIGCAPAWRIANPPAPVRQLLELVRAHRVFEIIPPRLAAEVA